MSPVKLLKTLNLFSLQLNNLFLKCFFFHFFHFELPLMSANDDDPPDSSWLENVSDESKDRSVIRSD